ncbi:hypothetical protein BTHE68_04240 [Burkholderia sp. THE68]|nr:hypothetical protein BTHE68_04240 [Burkholderia sp. THE68]BCQ22319.1 hypothetical protein NK8_04280 [Caballeronia sp. NK8]
MGAGVRGVDVHPASPPAIAAASATLAIAPREFVPKPSLCTTTRFLMLVVLNYFNAPARIRTRGVSITRKG